MIVIVVSEVDLDMVVVSVFGWKGVGEWWMDRWVSGEWVGE